MIRFYSSIALPVPAIKLLLDFSLDNSRFSAFVADQSGFPESNLTNKNDFLYSVVKETPHQLFKGCCAQKNKNNGKIRLIEPDLVVKINSTDFCNIIYSIKHFSDTQQKTRGDNAEIIT